MEGEPLLLQLLNLPPSLPAGALDEALEALWSTRRTGLPPHRKPHLHSLLGLRPSDHLDPVLACLRLIIRKCVRENLARDDMEKLFPVNLSSEVQSILVMLLEKYQDQWKEEASTDEPLWLRNRAPYQVAGSPVPTPIIPSELSSSLWPRGDDAISNPDGHNLSGLVTSYGGSNRPRMSPNPITHCRGYGSHNNTEILPRLKSMTWTMDNRSLPTVNRVAIITLVLQDQIKSPSGETEVKFLVSKDTLEAMLRQMTFISEQLSNSVVQPSELLSKKQKL